MPPRVAPGNPTRASPLRGRGGPPRGGARGAPTRLPDTSGHITTIGVKRPSFGASGRTVAVYTNHFEVSIPEGHIHHYDVISPSEKTLPARLNMEIIKRLQTVAYPDIFTPRAAYDGRKNLFAVRELPFGGPSKELEVTLTDPPAASDQGGQVARPPKVYKVKLTHVATINPEVLSRFLQGKQSHDNTVLTSITALNVVIRQEPSLNYPFNVRSFFTPEGKRDIGGGIELWRGYFQSVRPAIGRMVINVDISTAAMYKAGSVIDVALAFLNPRNSNDPSCLAPTRGFPERERVKLQRFLAGVRVDVNVPGQPIPASGQRPPRVIKRLTTAGANALKFTKRDGTVQSVAGFFQQTHNYRLRYPDIVCIEVGSGALIPMECCTLPEGQFMRKQIPPEKTKDVLEFATKKPEDRLASIKRALGVLQYGQSEYVRQFGMAVSPNAAPQTIQARVLDPPTLKYGAGSRQPTIKPRDGAWNMIDKKFYKPAHIKRWMVVIYEREGRFNRGIADEMVQGMLSAFSDVGIRVDETKPLIMHQIQTGIVSEQLQAMGNKCWEKNNRQGGPDLIVAVLPEASTDLYQAIKHFGDCTKGVATQCLKSSKCSRAKPQYFANVCLKINVKLGGVNTIPDPRSVPVLTDPHNPTVVMGADVIHPAPGADGRPSFTSLVSSIDSETAKYAADCRVQTSRQEMIEDLESMAIAMLKIYQKNRAAEKKDPNPKRIIFYRDGVSEGQFQHVLDFELPQLKAALQKLGIAAKITMIVVGKRHHVRFFPQRPNEADRSGNCPAGTVVDSDITHPTEFDFYLQSHSGYVPFPSCDRRAERADTVYFFGVSTLLGTSRPAHYNVLHDENKFTPDSLQALSFALCHLYARSTRSVSIPAPVYYADIVCSRAKNHYSPNGLQLDLSDSLTPAGDVSLELEAFRANFKPLNERTRELMYYS